MPLHERNAIVRPLAWALLALAPGTAPANDAFYRVPVAELKITEGTWPQAPAIDSPRASRMQSVLLPYATLDGEGEAFVDGVTGGEVRGARVGTLAIRAPEGRAITGRLFVPG